MAIGTLNASSCIQHTFGSSSSLFRCTRWNPWKKEGTSDLVVRIDGTSDQFDQNNMELFAKVDPESTHTEQFVYYSSVTRPKSSHTFGRMLQAICDMAVVQLVLDAAIRDACFWLEQTYREGDQIYLLGSTSTQPLSNVQKKFIGELKMVVEKGDDRERAVATMTLVRLCKAPIIRAELREIKLLDVFIHQLRRKGNALLPAYALVTCLKYSDMKECVKDNKDWPKYIVDMLKKDSFDDAFGDVEGFRVFGDFMRDGDLREEIMKFDIIHVLETKLRKGETRGNRTGLIYLGIFQTYDSSCISKLVGVSLEHLKSPQTWKTGAMILSALTQTDQGTAAVCHCMPGIIEMLLPEDYRRLRPTCPPITAGSSMPLATTKIQAESIDLLPSSRLAGPVRTLRILTRNETLRNHICRTHEYNHLKELYYESGVFVGKTGKWPWQKWDGIRILSEIFEAVDHNCPQALQKTYLVKNADRITLYRY